jgi:2-methylisocitrate lyase-like PEP mutase family enzyme
MLQALITQRLNDVAAQQLRTLLSGRDVAPGAYDRISALTIEQAGFKCAYMTGSGTAAARGFPAGGSEAPRPPGRTRGPSSASTRP